MDKHRTSSVAICVCTFKRSAQLSNLLRGIERLAFHKSLTPELRIVVVDNDELASAKAACNPACLRWPIEYVVEPKRGISYARNRAVREAGNADFLALIDDDEIPSPYWLDELLWAQVEFGADIVSGPVLPQYDKQVPEWITNGGFFDPRVAPTGEQRMTCATNNVLIAAKVFRDLKFDDEFAMSGAEDTHFFLRAHKLSYRIVWSQEACVFETIGAERGRVGWLFRREYQTGNGWVFCERAVQSSCISRISRCCKACGHIAIGSMNAFFHFAFLRKAALVRSLQRVTLGLGMLAGLVGHRFLAYKHAHSDRKHPVATPAEPQTEHP